MKLLWVLFIAVVTTNLTQANSVIDKVLEKNIVESDVPKATNPTSYAITRRRNISLFLNRPHRENNFVVNLNPTMKAVRQTVLEKYRKPFMKKLLIKDINNKNNFKATSEVTTRKSLMQRKNFTVRAHDVFAKTIRKKYNWNRNNSAYNLQKSKSETNITKEKLQPDFEEKISMEESQNINRVDMSINGHDFVNFEKQHINNTKHIHDLFGLRKSKRLLLFPKRNNLNYLTENSLKLGSENETSNIGNDQNSNVTILEDDEIITIIPAITMKSDSKDQLEEVREPKENTSDQEEKDREEFIYVKDVNQNVVSNDKQDVSGYGRKTIGQMKAVRQTELEKYRKSFMKKLLIKDINNKNNFKATSEVTTRKSLMQRKNFTERPRDVFAKTIHKKYNWNRNNSAYNLQKSKSETNITKEKLQPGFEEKISVEESQNINRVDMSINGHDFVDFEKQHINNTKHIHDLFGLRKSKRFLLFPKRNNLNYLTENSLKLGSENKTSNVGNDQNSNVTILEDDEIITIIPEITMKSDSKDQLEEVKEPKENTSDQEEKDREEFIYVKDVNQNVVSNDKQDVSGNGRKTIGLRFRFYSFMKNKL